MAVRTFYERDVLEVGGSAGLRSITPFEKGLLASLEPKLPKGTFFWTAKGIRFGSFSGVLQVGGDTWEVLPKIWRGPDASEANRSLLIHLLRLSRYLPWLKSWPGALDRQRHHLLEVFVVLFCNQLSRTLVGGMARSYRAETADLAYIRGRMDANALSLRMPGQEHRVTCRYEEFDEEIPINRAFRFCLDSLSKRSLSNATRNGLEQLRLRFSDVSRWSPRLSELSSIKLDRTQSRFAVAWDQCMHLLRGLYPDAAAGANPQASLLFDMEPLFEDVVSRCIRSELFPKGFQVHLQGPRQDLIDDGNGAKGFRVMKPDILLVSPEGRRIILDCKWKELDPLEPVFGISQSDLYQLHTYAGEYKAQASALIYPWVPGLPIEPVRYMFKESQVPLWLVFIPMDTFGTRRSVNLTGNWGKIFE